MITNRILQAVTMMNRGGLETMLMNYYRNIDRTKIQFDFLVHRQEKGAYDDEIEEMGGRIYRMLPIHPKNFMKYKKQLEEFFKHHTEYNVVHAHLDTLSTFVLQAAKQQGVPVRVAHSHSTNYDLDLKAFFREYSRWFLNNECTHRFACSEKAGRWLFGNKYRDGIIIQNNSIETRKFTYKEDIRRQYRQKLNLQDKYIIGHIGRFNNPKNHKFIIDIFNTIHKKYDNAVLVLVGQGELEQDIIRKVKDLDLKDSVVFLGIRADVDRVIQAFDVFLFPSLFEGLPVAMIEAQAAGLKCIISDTISAEVEITDLVEFISLTKSPAYWAERTLQYKNGYNRKDMYDEIVNSRYDITENAKWLETFYLTQCAKNG